MKKFLTIFFITLGVIFLILIISIPYFFIFGPLKVGSFDSSKIIGNSEENSEQTDHPYLNESQESALRAFGIDPASLPSEITPEQEACFESKLGEERVAEIKAGDSPTATDYFKAKDCL